MGKLPLRVGEPAGGSLTADEYKLAALVAWPLIIPVVWEQFCKTAIVEYEKAQESYAHALARYELDYQCWRESQASNGNAGTDSTDAPREGEGSR